MYIVSEMRVTIKLCVSTICGSTAFYVSSEDVNNSMLYLFRYCAEVHIVTTSSRAFDLKIVSIVLIEPLERLDEKEVRCKLWLRSMWTRY